MSNIKTTEYNYSLQNRIADPQKPRFVKGDLHYKTITCQNVPSEAQVKSFFV